MSKISKLTDKELQDLITKSTTWTELASECGYKRPGCNLNTIRKELDKRGLVFIPVEKSKQINFTKYRYIHSGQLKARLLKDNIFDYICQECGISEWQNKSITLQLDHINGDSDDNNVDNLRILCPNCHSKTDTWKTNRPKKLILCECGKEKYRTSKKCISCTFKNRASKKNYTISNNNRVYKIENAIFEEFVKTSASLIEIARKCGYNGGGNTKIIKHRINELNLDTSHFNPTNIGKILAPSTVIPLNDILDNKVPTYKSAKLRKRLVKELNWDDKCNICGIDNLSCSLELDHIDGNHQNNNITNLRILCPNCHSQTTTWCGKNTLAAKTSTNKNNNQLKNKFQNQSTCSKETISI